jgi:type IV secretion system protein VirB4
MTLAMGGQFYDLSAESPTISFQPMRSLNAEGELTWVHGWLVDLLVGEGVDMTPSAKQDLWSALANLAAMHAPHRTITTFLEVIQNESIRQALRSYALVGPYGNLLDADHDSLGDSSWQAFEMEGLMRSPALGPVLTNVFHRIEQRFGTTFHDDVTRKELSRPTMLILDEAWLFLGNSTFAAKIREWLKTLRKKNVAVVFATQSLSDVASSTISESVMESCPTRIFLPDSRAEEASFTQLYRTFGLNDQQIKILQHAIPKRDYYYQSPAGNRLFQICLGEVGLAFSRGGSPEVQVAVPRILAEHGADGFPAAYLREFAPDAPATSKGSKDE